MVNRLDDLVQRYERGALTRRELIAALAALCAAPGMAHAGANAAQEKGPIEITGLDHVALRVSDVPRSVDFYRQHLGGQVRSQSSNSAFLDMGRNWIALFGQGAVSTGFPPTPTGVDHVSFRSAARSFEERFQALKARGLEPSSPPGSGRVYFRDPDGVILQLS